MRLSAELLGLAEQRPNALQERELVLRGLAIPTIEHLGATRDAFDAMDFTDNRLTRLENFPKLSRLTSLYCAGNLIETFDSPNLAKNVPNVTTLDLSNNQVSALHQVDNLGKAFPSLDFLSFKGNPVTRKQHYRLYTIQHFPALKVLDMQRIKQAERDQAERLSKSAAGAALESDVQQQAKTFVPGGEASNFSISFTAQQKQAIRAMVAAAKTPQEIDEIDGSVKRGIFPTSGVVVVTPPDGAVEEKKVAAEEKEAPPVLPEPSACQDEPPPPEKDEPPPPEEKEDPPLAPEKEKPPAAKAKKATRKRAAPKKEPEEKPKARATRKRAASVPQEQAAPVVQEDPPVKEKKATRKRATPKKEAAEEKAVPEEEAVPVEEDTPVKTKATRKRVTPKKEEAPVQATPVKARATRKRAASVSKEEDAPAEETPVKEKKSTRKRAAKKPVEEKEDVATPTRKSKRSKRK